MSINELLASDDHQWEPKLFDQPEPWKPLAAYAVYLVEDSLWQEHTPLQARAKRAFSLLYSDNSTICQAAISALQNEEQLSQKLALSKAKFDKFCNEQAASLELQRSLLEKSAKKLQAAFQVGMENKSLTNCFLISVVQALCRIPNLRSSLKNQAEESKEIKRLFFAIFDKLQKNEPVAHEEVQNFRLACTKEGFHTLGDNTQEDADEFCNFLLPKLGYSPFNYTIAVSHNVDAPVPSLDRQNKGGSPTYMISLPLGEAKDGTDLGELLAASLTKEQVDADSIFNSDSVDLKDENVLRKLEALPTKPYLVNTLQAIKIVSAASPEFLVVSLRRFNNELNKISRRIVPAMKIVVFSDEMQHRAYDLKAIVVHKGDDIQHGHYYTYVPQLEAWKEFNDSQVHNHPDYMLEKRAPHDPLTPHEDSTCNGYLYFYQICT